MQKAGTFDSEGKMVKGDTSTGLGMLTSLDTASLVYVLYAVLSVILIGGFLRNGLAARRNRRRLRDAQAVIAVQEAVTDAHCMINATDPQGRITFANELFLSATGYDADEVAGQPISAFYAESNAERRAETIRAHLHAHGMWSGEVEMRCKSGERIWTHCTVKARHDRAGNIQSMVSLRTDITEAKRAQSDRQLRTIFDHLPEEVFIFSAQTQAFTYANLAALRHLGADASQIVMRRASLVPGFLSSPDFQAHLKAMHGSDRSLAAIRQADGAKVLDITVQLIRSEDQSAQFFVLAKDITDHMQTERAKAEFVSTVSHELRTPLTSIKGALGVLSSGAMGSVSENAQAILTMAQRNTERLILLINDLLDLEKLDAGQADMSRSPCELGSLVADVVEMNAGYAMQFGVTVEARVPPGLATISGNRDRLIQVLVNLVSNAVKFTPTGETVVVELTSRQGGYRVSVADRGPGVPEELKSRIFERFTQGRSTGAQPVAGTGLGLSISKAIIERHDGRIDFHPGAEGGTVFYFDLPALRDSLAA